MWSSIELFDDLSRHTESGRGIFAVGNDEIDPVLLDDPRKKFPDGPSSRLAHNISDKEYLHGHPIAQNRRPSSPG